MLISTKAVRLNKSFRPTRLPGTSSAGRGARQPTSPLKPTLDALAGPFATNCNDEGEYMSDRKRWSRVTDGELAAAEQSLSDYTEEGQQEIRDEIARRRNEPVSRDAEIRDPESQSWICGACGERNENGFEVCWNCQGNFQEGTPESSDSFDEKVLEPAGGAAARASSSLKRQLEERYRDAYRVARATTMVAGLVKFVGATLAALGVIVAWIVSGDSGALAVAAGIGGMGVGLLVFGMGVLIAAQGQHLLASIDDVVGGTPFLSDKERAEIMRLDMGEEQ